MSLSWIKVRSRVTETEIRIVYYAINERCEVFYSDGIRFGWQEISVSYDLVRDVCGPHTMLSLVQHIDPRIEEMIDYFNWYAIPQPETYSSQARFEALEFD